MHDSIRSDLRLPLVLGCALACTALGCAAGLPGAGANCPPPAVATALNDAQRRAFLHYYSPILLKQAQEGLLYPGRDWITNFDFDADGGKLHNNRANWEYGLAGFVGGGYPNWRIRPTLYSHVIEFMEGSAKSLVLVYHVYHAMQIGSIHDWERIEIRLDGVTGNPGGSESVRFVVITKHSSHLARAPAALSFHATPHGRHVLIWQAPWGFGISTGMPHAAQLNFVADSWAALDEVVQGKGLVTVAVDESGTPTKRAFHYVFVDGADPAAAGYWGAGSISGSNALQHVAGVPSPLPAGAGSVKRIQYELQDTADLFASHLAPAAQGGAGGGFFDWLCRRDEDCDDHGNPNWSCPRVTILLDDPIVDESGAVEVGVGRHDFLSQAIDELNPLEDRRGYPRKHWFWGTYFFNKDGQFRGEAYEDGAPNATRGPASGHDSHGEFWYQHDYFAHTGVESSGSDGDAEVGQWLCGGWHRASSGGFDGRWVQLFPD